MTDEIREPILRDLEGYARIQEHLASCVASADHEEPVALAFVEASIRVALHYFTAESMASTLHDLADQIAAVVDEEQSDLRRRH